MEDIKIVASAETYEDAMISAFTQVKKFLREDEQVFRDEPDALTYDDGDVRPWWLGRAECEVSSGGTTVCCDFYFERHTP